MKVIVEKADGTPVSAQDTEMLLKYLKDRFSQSPGEKKEHTGSFPDTEFDIEILLEEDSANVYALAICPGIKKEQIEITVDDGRLSISTNDAVKDDTSGNKAEKHHFQEYIDQLK